MRKSLIPKTSKSDGTGNVRFFVQRRYTLG